MSHLRFRPIVFTAFLLLLSFTSLQAQRTFGVIWDIPENPETAIKQLMKFSEIGISVIEIQEEPAPEIWEQINELGLNVYGNIGIKFPIADTFANPDTFLIQEIQEKASVYYSQPSVQAVGLFEYGATNNAEFVEAVHPFVERLHKAGQTRIYYKSNRPIGDSLIADFVIRDVRIKIWNEDLSSLQKSEAIGAYQYSPSRRLLGYVRPFKQFLEATSECPQKIVFVHSDWLFSVIEKYPPFASTLSSFSSEQEAIFPLPDESAPEQNKTPIPVIALLIIWGTVAIHYHSSPLYRKSLFRYFLGHKFFIKDIFQRYIRSSYTAILIILQNMFMISVCVFATFTANWSPLGMEAFFHHFPILGLFAHNPISLLIWTCLGILLLAFISAVWLFLVPTKIESITQVLTIYAWPQQINFILGTIAITLFASASSSLFVFLLTFLMILITLLSFVFTSVDVSKFLKSKSQLYLLATSGIYLILLGVLFGWAMTKSAWWDILILSANL